MSIASIFVSHMTPRHNEEADFAVSALGMAGPMVTVVGSFNFDRAGDAVTMPIGGARSKQAYSTVCQALADAACLLVLLPPADELGDAISIGHEIGRYEQICAQNGREPLVFCLHHPDVDPQLIARSCHAPQFTSVSASNIQSVTRLIERICELAAGQPGFSLNPANAGFMTSQLLASVRALVPTERHRTAALVTITIPGECLGELAKGQIPPNALIGGQGWTHLFGLPTNEGGILWKDIQPQLQDIGNWEPIVAGELHNVQQRKQQSGVIPILLNESDSLAPPSAVIYRYEVIPSCQGPIQQVPDPERSRMHRFSLIAFRSPMLYDPEDMSPRATSFHLMIVAQLWRNMLHDQSLKNMKNLISAMPNRSKIGDFETRLAAVIAAVRRDRLFINVECRRRNFLSRLAAFDRVVFDAFEVDAGDDHRLDGLQHRLVSIMREEWVRADDGLSEELSRGLAGLKDAAASIARLAEMNKDVIAIASSCYARLASNNSEGATGLAESDSKRSAASTPTNRMASGVVEIKMKERPKSKPKRPSRSKAQKRRAPGKPKATRGRP
ncbi:MAG: hypothetical protein JSR77_00540 [Planctomycetes bacterium]|nr:hypothetical protein [Planctomycetota bacterium]